MTAIFIVAAALVLSLAMLSFTFLRAWRGWLELRRLELARHSIVEEREESEGEVGLRIELAAVKERLKKLEAIASGVEL
jgi:hypothetical protein